MEIKFTPKQLETLTNNGITMDDLKNSVKSYREQGYSDEDIQRGLWGTIKKMDPHVLNPVEFEEKSKRQHQYYLNQAKNSGVKIPEFSEEMSYAERNKILSDLGSKKRAENQKSRDWWMKWEGRAAAAVDNFGSNYTLGIHDAMLWASDKLFGTDNAKFAKEMREEHPGYAVAGSIAGVLSPGSAMKAGLKWVNGLANTSQTAIAGAKVFQGSAALAKTGKVVGWGAKVLENAVGFQALETMRHTAQGFASDESLEAGEKALEQFGNDTMSNMAWDVAISGVTGVGGKLFSVFSKAKKSTKAAGGLENLSKGKDAAQAVRDAGGSEADAATAFYGTITEGMDREAKATFEKLLANDEEFAKFMQQQASTSKQFVVDTANELTAQQYAKLSNVLLENAWGTAKNTLGKYEVDFTKKGLDQLLGLDAKGSVMEARKQALARAEQKVMASPSLARDVKVNFDGLSRNLKTNGSLDLERAFSKVEPGSLKSFEGSIEQTEAIARAQRKIAAWEKQVGQPMNSGEVERLMNAEMRVGAEDHFRKIMAEGTDSVQDINDIKNFFDKEFAAEVKEGKAEAIGAFTEGVNTQILDNLDDVLYQSNQAMRLGKELKSIHDFGAKYDNSQFNALESLLNNGTDAKQKAMKLATFKMGMLSKASEAVASGQPGALQGIRDLMTSGKLKKYFTPEEVGGYIDQLRPKAEAAHTLNGILNTAYTLRGEDINTLAPAIRAGVAGTILHSPNVFMNSLVTLASRISPYGPKTASYLNKLAHNPDWKTFNEMVAGVKDPAEKNFLRQQIVAAFEAARESLQGE